MSEQTQPESHQPSETQPPAGAQNAAAQGPQEEHRSPSLPDLRFPVTRLLIGVNVLVFAIMCVASAGEAFMEPTQHLILSWGADYGPLTLTGEYWRIFSSMFLHIGVVHLLMNMWALWVIGRSVEDLFGASKYLYVYLAGGVAGALSSLFFHPAITSAGASGAIMAAFGGFLAFVLVNKRWFKPEYVKGVMKWIAVFMIINLYWGYSRPGIDNAAHIGGFIGGVLAGFAVAPRDPRVHRWSVPNMFRAMALAAGLVAVCFWEISAFHSP